MSNLLSEMSAAFAQNVASAGASVVRVEGRRRLYPPGRPNEMDGGGVPHEGTRWGERYPADRKSRTSASQRFTL